MSRLPSFLLIPLSPCHQSGLNRGQRAAESCANLIFDVLDNHFSFPEVEGLDPEHLEDVACSTGGRGIDDAESPLPSSGCPQGPSVVPGLTERQMVVFGAARLAYERGMDALRARLPEETRTGLELSWRELEAVTDGWESAAAGLLRKLSSRYAGDEREAVVHVIVTRGEVMYGMDILASTQGKQS